jgi:hypothetical protein
MGSILFVWVDKNSTLEGQKMIPEKLFLGKKHENCPLPHLFFKYTEQLESFFTGISMLEVSPK